MSQILKAHPAAFRLHTVRYCIGMSSSFRNEDLSSAALKKHVLSTYFSLRVGIVVIAVAFPVLLATGGYFYVGVGLLDSMSAYYHVTCEGRSMRDWFVGLLFAVGVFLYLYKGTAQPRMYC